MDDYTAITTTGLAKMDKNRTITANELERDDRQDSCVSLRGGPTNLRWTTTQRTNHRWMVTLPATLKWAATQQTNHMWMVTQPTNHKWMETQPTNQRWMVTQPTNHRWIETQPANPW